MITEAVDNRLLVLNYGCMVDLQLSKCPH